MKTNLCIWLINKLQSADQDKKISKSGHEWLKTEIHSLETEKTPRNQEYNPFFFMWNLQHLIDDKVHLTTYDLKILIDILSTLIINICGYLDGDLGSKKN